MSKGNPLKYILKNVDKNHLILNSGKTLDLKFVRSFIQNSDLLPASNFYRFDFNLNYGAAGVFHRENPQTYSISAFGSVDSFLKYSKYSEGINSDLLNLELMIKKDPRNVIEGYSDVFDRFDLFYYLKDESIGREEDYPEGYLRFRKNKNKIQLTGINDESSGIQKTGIILASPDWSQELENNGKTFFYYEDTEMNINLNSDYETATEEFLKFFREEYQIKFDFFLEDVKSYGNPSERDWKTIG